MFEINPAYPSFWLFWGIIMIASVGLLLALFQMTFWKKEPWAFGLFFSGAILATAVATFFAVTGKQFLAEWFSVTAILALVITGYVVGRDSRK